MTFLLPTLFMVGLVAAPDVAQELVRLEQQLTDALASTDTQTVERLWADDLVFVGTTGKVSSKSDRLAGMRTPTLTSTPAVASVANDEVKVRVYEQAAVVTLRSTWTTRTNDREVREHYMTTHVWIKRRGRWQLVSAQVSRIAP